jgi:hypothetical protein
VCSECSDYVEWVLCHHGTARPQVADGGKPCRVAVNILNKQPRTMTRGGPPAWGLGKGLTTPYHKIKHVMKCYTGSWNRDRWRALVNMVMNLRGL